VVQLLIKSGLSSFNLEDFAHKLLYTIRFGQMAVVQLLLESVNMNYKWENSQTLLLLAAEKGHKDMV
jgi:ankyrin repeat protein